ncbi:hypothetical protein [Candidatus Nitrotoga arctica]|uniref:hypothetical protein n=1 Tax=Candidatus Nitrotoga arctica TaxID=453162 RepID=UPI001EFBF9C3|nr:hypothetical protein [Candidatus Nitrotoga arctica]
MIQTNCVAQGFIDAHGVGIQKMNLAIPAHFLNVSRFKKQSTRLHNSPSQILSQSAHQTAFPAPQFSGLGF